MNVKIKSNHVDLRRVLKAVCKIIIMFINQTQGKTPGFMPAHDTCELPIKIYYV